VKSGRPKFICRRAIEGRRSWLAGGLLYKVFDKEIRADNQVIVLFVMIDLPISSKYSIKVVGCAW
jgi:hypothetical protein